jgi:transcriptional regulator with XRE-family HTH domain
MCVLAYLVQSKRSTEGLSQRQLAFKANVSNQLISMLERGASIPDDANLRSIAGSLCLDPHVLLAAAKLERLARAIGESYESSAVLTRA